VVGSNIANIALVLGLVAIIFPIKVKKKGVWIDWAVMMFASLLLYFFSWNNQELNIWEGITFLMLLVAYMLWLIYDTRSNKDVESKKGVTPDSAVQKQKPLLFVALVFVLSVIALYFGSGWLVDGARNIALDFGISERVVGITVIAFGTSVPELVTSLIAAFKKNTDISIGNIIGSNIFNIFAILGVTASVKRLDVNVAFLEKDYLWMIGIALLLFLFLLPLRKGVISRWKGVILVTVYVVYIYFLF
jgi:cation:H+ antiporter